MSDCTFTSRRFQLICAPLRAILPKLIAPLKNERHCRKFGAKTHLLLSLYAQILHISSANLLLAELNDLGSPQSGRNLRQMVGFDFVDKETSQPVQLNQSSFSRANLSHPYTLWHDCFVALLPYVRNHCRPHYLAALGPLLAIDGSLFDCLGRMLWASYTHSSHKVRGHFLFDLAGLPTKLVLTTGKGSERTVLRQNLQAGVTYLMDRGYNDYALFRQIEAASSHFVTRLLVNAAFEVVQSWQVTPAQRNLGVVTDQLIRFSHSAEVSCVRRVEWVDVLGNTFSYISSRQDIEPYLIVQLYKNRWLIERFFAWTGQHLQLKHWYSENENGVLIQLYAALIMFLLLKLFSAVSGLREFRTMNIEFVNWVQRHLFDGVLEWQIEAYLHTLGFAHSVLIT